VMEKRELCDVIPPGIHKKEIFFRKIWVVLQMATRVFFPMKATWRNPPHSTYVVSIYLSIYLWLYNPLLDLGRLFSFLILYTVGRTPWTGDQPIVRPLPTHRTTQTQNKSTQTSMPWVGFEPTIPVFDGARRRFMP
jgi:hypothetical protein